MPALIFTSVDGQRTELPLKPGVNRVGRVEGNDILVPDDSVSESHCELTVAGDQVMVRDLGSATGTTVNGAAVQEGPILNGEGLRVGNVEFTLQDDAPAEATRAALLPGENCRSHPMLAAKWRCSKCGELACDTCVTDGRAMGVPRVKFCRSCKSHAVKIGESPTGGKSTGTKTFGGEMLAAWAYPFRREGPIIMLTGAIFFTIAGFGQRVMFLIGGLIFVMTTGYWMAYAQKVVQGSAQGEDEPPTWPDLSDFLGDIVAPFFQAVGLFALYLLPAWLALIFLPKDEVATGLIAGGLLLIGLFMMPMAWLAISMHESIAGLSPHFVIPSILRIPGHYLLIFVELVVLVAINVGLEMLLNQLAIPFVGGFISSFLSVYFMMVLCRLLGSMYFLNRARLGWF